MAYLDVVLNDSNLEFSDGTVKPASEEEKDYFWSQPCPSFGGAGLSDCLFCAKERESPGL